MYLNEEKRWWSFSREKKSTILVKITGLLPGHLGMKAFAGTVRAYWTIGCHVRVTSSVSRGSLSYSFILFAE